MRRGVALELDGPDFKVHLDRVRPEDHLTDDIAFLEAIDPDTYFYLSGGGSLLLEGRYLLVVRRPEAARVNPGRWSLFTGRANGPEEWREPRRVAREFFEELVLLRDGDPVPFAFTAMQPLIDEACAGRSGSGKPIRLEQAGLVNGTATVCSGGLPIATVPGFWHVSRKNDINLLFLFEAAVKVETLEAVDGEAWEGGPGREIAALDLHEPRLRALTPGADRCWRRAVGLPMTEHLAALVRALGAAPRL